MPETKSFWGVSMMVVLSDDEHTCEAGDLSEKDIDELEEILKNARENAEKKG